MYIMWRVCKEVVDFEFLNLQRSPIRIVMIHKIQLDPILDPKQFILNKEVIVEKLLIV